LTFFVIERIKAMATTNISFIRRLTSIWLRETNPARLQELYDAADRARREHVGDDVHLRGLVEISNHCRRRCAYCGVNADRHLKRYRLTDDEILECARRAIALDYGTLVLQSGEDPGRSPEDVARLIRRIKQETPLAVTLSLGEWPADVYALWRDAGADRYLLRFETSNPDLYARIHPPIASDEGAGDRGGSWPHRRDALTALHRLGFEVGSGVMVGIPGQGYDDLARDLLLFRELDLDMIGIGPYLPHPDTPMGRHPERFPPLPSGEQVPNNEATTVAAVALARLLCPDANIPATTAVAVSGGEEARVHALRAGANIVMPNLTPPECRALYEIYPGKAVGIETAEAVTERLSAALARIGRRIGSGPGGRACRRAE